MILSWTSSAIVDLDEGVLQSLHRTGHVALEDEGERGALALLDPLEQGLQRRPAAAVRLLGRPLAGLALLGDLPGDAVLADGEERVAGTGHRGQTEHQHRTGRTGASGTGLPFSSSMARTRP